MAQRKSKTSKSNPFENAPVINPLQLGGIETSVLDNGAGRDVRIAWVNTGAGLRYKVVIDRGLDIADAEFMGQSLTWLSLTGTSVPSQSYNKGMDWLRGFFGGLVVSCGPLNTGAPFEEDGASYGLHGTHSNSRALVESIINPDPSTGELEMRITGIVRLARVFGPNVELKRTIRSTLGEPTIHIQDQFTNRGNQPVPHCWLLHINFGYPLLEPGASTYCYKGTIDPRPDSTEWFTKRKDYKAAPKPVESHRGTGEAFTYVNPKSDSSGKVIAGVVNKKREFGVMIEYNNKDYPRMGNWQHWGPNGSYTGALEPMTAGVEGRPLDEERNWLRTLEPGQQCELNCSITATDDQNMLDRLLKLNQ
jgi:hypothetical protein